MGLRSVRREPDTGAAGSPWQVPPMGSGEAPPDEATDAVPDQGGEPRERVVSATPPDTLLGRVGRPPGGRHLFTWVSAHGGAGATSLARASGTGADLTGEWPAPDLGWPTVVALVCRSNAAGLQAAGRLLREAASGQLPDLEVAALVVVADAPTKPSKQIRQRIHELSGAAPRLVRVPWIAAWRDAPYTPDPAISDVAETVAAVITQEGDSQ